MVDIYFVMNGYVCTTQADILDADELVALLKADGAENIHVEYLWRK